MAVFGDNRCSCCRRLFGLGAECTIITAIIVHVLLTTGELLIHLDVIQAPNADTSVDVTSSVTTVSPATTNVTSATYDPGGTTCNNEPAHDSLLLIVQIFRYVTLVLSGIFLVEIFCKAVYLRKLFFKDLWQLLDMFIIILSLGAEITFFIFHDKLMCFHPASEVFTYVIIFRLWRLPRVCNIRKKEYRGKLDDEIRYLTQTKMETELRFKQLEEVCKQQIDEIDTLKSTIGTSVAYVTVESDKIPNGKVHGNGYSESINNVLGKGSNGIKHDIDTVDGVVVTEYKPDVSVATDKQHSELERNDSDVNSKATDSGIEEKDSFRNEKKAVAYVKKAYERDPDEVFDDSDGSETPVEKRVIIQRVEVQIEEPSRQKQLPSISKITDVDADDQVMMRSNVQAFVNRAYDTTGEDSLEDIDKSLTYRSADGIPMTDL